MENNNMEKKSRCGVPNFTNNDNMLLCEIITKYKNIIENKNVDGPTLRKKQQAWMEVQKEFNSLTTSSRSLESLQQNFMNLKEKANKRFSEAKLIMMTTNEGEFPGCDYKPLFGPTTHDHNESSKNEIPLKVDINNESNTNEEVEYIDTDIVKEDMETPQKHTVTNKFKTLAYENKKLIKLQQQLIMAQLKEEKEKFQHNHTLREMEMEDAKNRYTHNEMIRQLELSKYKLSVADMTKDDDLKAMIEKTIEKFGKLLRLSAPEEISDLIFYVASNKALSITGSNYLIDNGIVLK